MEDQENYLDLTFIIGKNSRLYMKLYDKRDDFNFHTVNFPFLSSKIPSGSSYILQLIKYARCGTQYDDFGYGISSCKLLVDRLLSQGYKVNRLRNSFQTFYGRHLNVVIKYQKSVRDMVNDSFPFLMR